MPVFIQFLWAGLLNIAGALVGQVLISLGIGLITYTGVSTVLGWAKSSLISALQGLPVEVVGMLSYMGCGIFISIITSAMAIRMTLDGLTGGSVKKLGRK